MSSCDDRGDETNSICGTKRYVWEANFDRRSGPPPKRTVPNEAAWTVDSGWNAPVSSAVGIPVGRLRCRAMLSNRETETAGPFPFPLFWMLDQSPSS